MREKKKKRKRKEENKIGMGCYKAQMTWEVLSEIWFNWYLIVMGN